MNDFNEDQGRVAPSNQSREIALSKPVSIGFPLHLISVNAMSTRFHNSTDRMISIRSEFVVSIAALALTLLLLCSGLISLFQLHDETQSLSWFPFVGVILVGYAFCHGVRVSFLDDFDGGRISARSAMIAMYCLTSLSFDGAALYMRGKTWSDSATIDWNLFVGGAVVTALFAFVYGVYANCCDSDRIYVKENQRRRWSARKAMVLMFLASLTLCVYNSFSATLAQGNVAGSIVCLMVTVVIYVATYIIFELAVHLKKDHGLS